MNKLYCVMNKNNQELHRVFTNRTLAIDCLNTLQDFYCIRILQPNGLGEFYLVNTITKLLQSELNKL